MFNVEVLIAIDSSSQTWPIIYKITLGLKVDNADNLLVKLTRTIMQTSEGAHVGLVDFMMASDVWIRQVRPVVAEQRTLIGCPASEAVD